MNKQFAAGLPRVLRPGDGNPGVRQTGRWTDGQRMEGWRGRRVDEGSAKNRSTERATD